MKIQFNTDKNIQGTEKLEAFVSEKINGSLERFADKITRIEVHLSDQNAVRRGKDDIQCLIEARLEGLQPVAVTGRGSSKEQSVNDAVDKMRSALATVIGKLKTKKL